MANAYNKITRVWVDTIDGSELTPAQDWIVAPVFADETLAMSMDQSLWTFDGVNINSPSQAEWDVIKLNRARELKWRDIQVERVRRRFGGVLLAGYWYHSDDTSRIQHLSLTMLGASLPPGIMWKTMSGAFIEMTPTLATQIFTTMLTQEQTIFGVAEYHRGQMMVSADPTNYNFSTSWPAMYGE